MFVYYRKNQKFVESIWWETDRTNIAWKKLMIWIFYLKFLELSLFPGDTKCSAHSQIAKQLNQIKFFNPKY